MNRIVNRLFQLINSLTSGRSRVPPEQPRKVLFYWNQGGIGDWLMFTPTLRALRNKYGSARFTLCVSTEFYDLVGGNLGFFDEIIVMPMKLELNRLRDTISFLGRMLKGASVRYDLLVNGYSVGGTVVNALTAFTRAAFKVGFSWNNAEKLYDKSFSPTVTTHLVQQNLQLAYSLGCPVENDRPAYHMRDEARREAQQFLRANGLEDLPLIIGVHPRTQVGKKNIPMDRLEEFLGQMSRMTDAGFLLFGSRADYDDIAPLAKALGRRAAVQAGQTGLEVAAALLQQCSLLITIDSGIMHLGRAMGIPILAFFVSTNPLLYGYEDAEAKCVKVQAGRIGGLPHTAELIQTSLDLLRTRKKKPTLQVS